MACSPRATPPPLPPPPSSSSRPAWQSGADGGEGGGGGTRRLQGTNYAPSFRCQRWRRRRARRRRRGRRGWADGEQRSRSGVSRPLCILREVAPLALSDLSLSISGQHRHLASQKQRAVLSVVCLECDPSRSSYTDLRSTSSLSALPAAAAAEVPCDGCEWPRPLALAASTRGRHHPVPTGQEAAESASPASVQRQRQRQHAAQQRQQQRQRSRRAR